MAKTKTTGQLSSPLVATIKRLFAVSGNQCAFPKCTAPLVEGNSGKVTGRICHIRARNAGGPRFDESQTDAERHAFENLILLCPVHHDVIDADEESYNIERLGQIKEAHEIANAGGKEPNDEVAKELVLSLDRATVIDGSIIFSNNQLGGQVAHQITNVGPQPRQISSAAAEQIIAALRQLPAKSVKITAILGDPESINLGMVLR